MVDPIIPASIHPPSAPALEVLSVVDRKQRAEVAAWFSTLMADTPGLRILNWLGAAITAPWAQFVHLSLISNATLGISWTTYSMQLSTSKIYDCTWGGPMWVDDPEDLGRFLLRSGCAIQHLELWYTAFADKPPIGPPNLRFTTRVPPALLLSPHICHSLTHLLISSHDLNTWFHWLEQETPGTLPLMLVLLRNVNLCFQIDDLPSIVEAETSGLLAGLIKLHLPLLEELYLDDIIPTMAGLECRSVGRFPQTFNLWRCSTSRREYQAWWESADGLLFQAARATQDASALLPFQIPWYQILDHDFDPDRNRFFFETRWP
ncbi:hypothetical protein B0H14DRAFT_2655088 [Mycena olivaceomarginata]|nr:hypothetical protein B0H14DRAFT_2655088 [Mycena olivaceomarginata]